MDSDDEPKPVETQPNCPGNSINQPIVVDKDNDDTIQQAIDKFFDLNGPINTSWPSWSSTEGSDNEGSKNDQKAASKEGTPQTLTDSVERRVADSYEFLSRWDDSLYVYFSLGPESHRLMWFKNSIGSFGLFPSNRRSKFVYPGRIVGLAGGDPSANFLQIEWYPGNCYARGDKPTNDSSHLNLAKYGNLVVHQKNWGGKLKGGREVCNHLCMPLNVTQFGF